MKALDVAAHADARPTDDHSGYDDVDGAICVFPDPWTGGAEMDLGIGRYQDLSRSHAHKLSAVLAEIVVVPDHLFGLGQPSVKVGYVYIINTGIDHLSGLVLPCGLETLLVERLAAPEQEIHMLCSGIELHNGLPSINQTGLP